MGWIGRAAAAIAVATICLAASGSSGAQAQTAAPACKAACNNNYSACQRRAINSDTCLRRWFACKKKCEGRPAKPAPAPAPR